MDQPKSYCLNRKATYNFFIEDYITAGIVLQGGEVKSIRNGSASIGEGYIVLEKGKVILKQTHIAQTNQKGFKEFKPTRDRELLLTKKEIQKLKKKIDEKGYTLIPYSFFPKKGLIKLTIAVARGKKLHDKREQIKKRDQERDLRRELK